jgi:myo-inositol-1-phosphate synthase
MAIRTALVGIGNCASSLVQAVAADRAGSLHQGLTHPLLGSYRVADIEIVAAFDVDSRKIGRPLDKAILAEPNCTTIYHYVPPSNVTVLPGPTLDGVSEHMADVIHVAAAARVTTVDDITKALREADAHVVVLYLPVGSQQAAEAYAQAALVARCALVNCTPAQLTNEPTWSTRFRDAGLPILGDDIKSQIGSTTLHRALIAVLAARGATITQTYQLNIGGNTDFRNMKQPARGAQKKATKEIALRCLGDGAPSVLSVGPSDFVPHLNDHKHAFINLQGHAFMGMQFSIEVTLKVEDSPNSAGVVVDALRAARIALDRRLAGPIHDVCPFLFKNAPRQLDEHGAAAALQRFAKSPSL